MHADCNIELSSLIYVTVVAFLINNKEHLFYTVYLVSLSDFVYSKLWVIIPKICFIRLLWMLDLQKRMITQRALIIYRYHVNVKVRNPRAVSDAHFLLNKH